MWTMFYFLQCLNGELVCRQLRLQVPTSVCVDPFSEQPILPPPICKTSVKPNRNFNHAAVNLYLLTRRVGEGVFGIFKLTLYFFFKSTNTASRQPTRDDLYNVHRATGEMFVISGRQECDVKLTRKFCKLKD